MAYAVMACVVMADVVMAHIVMAYIVMAHVVVVAYSYSFMAWPGNEQRGRAAARAACHLQAAVCQSP